MCYCRKQNKTKQKHNIIFQSSFFITPQTKNGSIIIFFIFIFIFWNRACCQPAVWRWVFCHDSIAGGNIFYVFICLCFANSSDSSTAHRFNETSRIDVRGNKKRWALKWVSYSWIPLLLLQSQMADIDIGYHESNNKQVDEKKDGRESEGGGDRCDEQKNPHHHDSKAMTRVKKHNKKRRRRWRRNRRSQH